MLFGFFRRIRRIVCFVLFFAAAGVLLRAWQPELGQKIGRWITGLGNTRVAQALSDLISGFARREGLSQIAEVFHEGLTG